MGGGGEGGDLLGRVDRAVLGRLGDADGGRLGEMHHAVDRLGERLGELLGIDLAGRPVDAHEPGAGVELDGVGFLGRDMRDRMAVDRAPRRRAAGERQHVGGGADAHRIGDQVGLVEDVAQAVLDALRPLLGTVGEGRARAEGAAHRLDDLWMGADLVVAAKVDQRGAPGGNSMVPSRAPVRGSTI